MNDKKINKMKNILGGKKKDLIEKSERAGEALDKIHERKTNPVLVKKEVVRMPTSISLDPEVKTSFEISVANLKAEAMKRGIKGINKSSVIEKLMIILSEDLENKGMESLIIRRVLKN